MSTFSPSRILLVAVASSAVALSGWYGFSAAFRDKDMQAPMNSPSLSPAMKVSDAPSKDSGHKDGSGLAEIATLRGDVNRLRDDLAALHSQFQAHADQIDTLHRQFQAHADQLSVLRAASERSPAPPPPGRELASSTATGFTDAAAAQAQEAALIQEEQERSRLRAQANEMEFSTQAVDRVWANEADGLLQEAFASAELKDTQLGGVQCRTTLCRIEIVHQDPDKRAQFEQYLPFMVTAQFSSIAMYTAESNDGSSSTVVYLARNGYPLPQDNMVTK